MTTIFNDIALSKDLKVKAIKCFFIIQIFLFHSAYSFAEDSNLNLLSVPNGFEISIFAENISSARQITEGSKYIVAASGSAGQIYALSDSNSDYVIDSNRIIAKDRFDSRGVTYKDGDLYFAEVDKI